MRYAWNDGSDQRTEEQYRNIHVASIRAFHDAIELAERFGADATVVAELYERLGAAHLAIGGHDEAVQAVERGIALDPENVHLWALMGDVYWSIYSFTDLPLEEKDYIAVQSAEYHERAVQLNGGTKPRWNIAFAYINASNLRYFRGDFKTSQQYAIIGITQLDQRGEYTEETMRWRDRAFWLLEQIRNQR